MDFIKNYELPISLWNMMLDNVPPNEIYEVKSFLGDDLVDQSIELRSEINTLMEIYKIYSNERAAGDTYKHLLPEPPEVRERLLKEIQFFVNGIREQARLQGRNADRLLEKCHSDIIDYAYESSSSRPTTSSDSYLSTFRSSYRATPISDRINVNLIKEKLNYIEFAEVQNNLKQYLEDEVNQLNSDLLEIHSKLYIDDTDICSSRSSKLSISDLKHERHELEQLLLQSSRPLSNTNINNKSKQSPTTNSKNPIFKLLPNAETTHRSNNGTTVKSPPRLKPIENKDNHKTSSYVESPLDLGLPETNNSYFDDIMDRNNSSFSNSDFEIPDTDRSMSPISISQKPGKYNSAQKFRQKVLLNRKETVHY